MATFPSYGRENRQPRSCIGKDCQSAARGRVDWPIALGGDQRRRRADSGSGGSPASNPSRCLRRWARGAFGQKSLDGCGARLWEEGQRHSRWSIDWTRRRRSRGRSLDHVFDCLLGRGAQPSQRRGALGSVVAPGWVGGRVGLRRWGQDEAHGHPHTSIPPSFGARSGRRTSSAYRLTTRPDANAPAAIWSWTSWRSAGVSGCRNRR